MFELIANCQSLGLEHCRTPPALINVLMQMCVANSASTKSDSKEVIHSPIHQDMDSWQLHIHLACHNKSAPRSQRVESQHLPVAQNSHSHVFCFGIV